MPKIVDPRARRRDVAEATLRVVARSGLEAASLRNVAEEAGLAVGSVRHYFSDHDELVVFAMRHLVDRIDRRVRAHIDHLGTPEPDGDLRARAEELLGEFLPLDATRHEEAVLWIALATAARIRPGLRPCAVELQENALTLMGHVLRGAQTAGGLPAGLDPGTESRRLAALIDGLTFQAVLQPDRYPPKELRRLLRHHLETLRERA
ncbi:TetR family transcriptional regulator [Streptomyces eurocidicus]|uniref:AcrR family transcriptional regulator n=1 Tax=Streptomyces eurocidicus TaxID=66423 RepID=A0A2N8NQ46_STREU|nr:TetR family transcriptional regulator C-terminal domain-containing protein [Streptomyces eurocidicus]MBB5122331.1 AcrR family transcriptional regulator [Streptomyces eurocidicus]MBF6051616.1 TetR family transcriptional regulator [Streptomyces eurocidicus]PNE30889.1 TetR family transcriptional regulator [Streptomyces eurocidicus]